jgi:predicted nucleic acid-binding protein
MTEKTIVGDSSPLIALSIIQQLTLLPKLYQRVVIPPRVWKETTVHGAGLPGAFAISQHG